ncbi:hypothetical protein MNB_SM-6-906 [hydrothermal vent metagenome]|uniref:Lipoprotein n=1 Tax=hydrothermal vent metagenome TaxID=652676 RepID=A0A1W1CSP2_9ZZZZ
MKRLLVLLLLIFQGCSFKSPQNKWQYESTAAFTNYVKNYLQGNNTIAKNDLKRAISNATKSADLTQLATIYLGECAVHISVGEKDTCKSYDTIAPLIKNQYLNAYNRFINKKFTDPFIKQLENEKQTFATLVSQQKIQSINSFIINSFNKPQSAYLYAALARNFINLQTIDQLIDLASYNGDKKVAIFWLKYKLTKLDNHKERLRIQQIIQILESHTNPNLF